MAIYSTYIRCLFIFLVVYICTQDILQFFDDQLLILQNDTKDFFFKLIDGAYIIVQNLKKYMYLLFIANLFCLILPFLLNTVAIRDKIKDLESQIKQDKKDL